MAQKTPKFRFDHMDARENMYFSRQLEHIRAKIAEFEFPDLKALKWVPMSEPVGAGKTEYTVRDEEMVGDVKLAATMTSRQGSVNVKDGETTSKIRSLQNHYKYSIQDIREAMSEGRDLSTRLAKAAKLAIAQKMDNILLLGDGTAAFMGLFGLFKLSNTNTYTVPADGTGASALWTAKTPDLILRDMNGMVFKIVTDSLEVEIPDTMLLPLSAYNHIATTPRSSTSDTTILEYFLRTNPHIKRIDTSTKLENAGSGNVARAVVYKKDPDKVEAVVPVPFEQFAPQTEGVMTITECHARVGGVVPIKVKSILYADGIMP